MARQSTIPRLSRMYAGMAWLVLLLSCDQMVALVPLPWLWFYNVRCTTSRVSSCGRLTTCEMFEGRSTLMMQGVSWLYFLVSLELLLIYYYLSWS